MTLESLLDNDKEIETKLDTDARSIIMNWLLRNVWISLSISRKSEDEKDLFRHAKVTDFSIDDKHLISLKQTGGLDGVSIFSDGNIPEYIRFSYVGKELKIQKTSSSPQDASFLLKNLSTKGIKDLTYILVNDSSIKTLGNLSKFDLAMFECRNNKYLNMKLKELPSVTVSITYTGNGNKFSYSELVNSKKVKYPGTSLICVDDRHTNEGLLDSDDVVKTSHTNTKEYYITVLAKTLVKLFKNKIDFKRVYDNPKLDYVYIDLKKDFLKRINSFYADDNTELTSTIPKLKNFLASEIYNPLLKQLYSEGLVKDNSIRHSSQVTQYLFTSFKLGDVKSFGDPGSNYIYPSIGIVNISRDHGYDPPLFYVDLGEEELNRKLLNVLKQIV